MRLLLEMFTYVQGGEKVRSETFCVRVYVVKKSGENSLHFENNRALTSMLILLLGFSSFHIYIYILYCHSNMSTKSLGLK